MSESKGSRSRMTFRLPSSLHRMISEAANRAGISVNDYINRELEKCVEADAVVRDALLHGTGFMQGGKRIDPRDVAPAPKGKGWIADLCEVAARPPEPAEADMARFGASDAACYLYPGEDQAKERAAFCEGAAHALAPAPAPEGE